MTHRCRIRHENRLFTQNTRHSTICHDTIEFRLIPRNPPPFVSQTSQGARRPFPNCFEMVRRRSDESTLTEKAKAIVTAFDKGLVDGDGVRTPKRSVGATAMAKALN